jgi:hypothetical protein
MATASNYSHILPVIRREGKVFNRAVTFEDDFTDAGTISATADAAKWLSTATEGGAGSASYALSDGEPNGVVALVSDAAITDSIELQANGESFSVTPGKRIFFEARLKLDDVDLTNLFVGIAATDTTVIDGVADYIGFFKAATDTTLSFGVCKNGSAAIQGSKTAASTTQDGETDEAISDVTLVDDTFVIVAFEVQPVNATDLRVKWFVNGAYKGTLNAIKDSSGNIQDFPDDVGLTPSLAMQNGSAVVRTVEVDYVYCVGDRQ